MATAITIVLRDVCLINSPFIAPSVGAIFVAEHPQREPVFFLMTSNPSRSKTHVAHRLFQPANLLNSFFLLASRSFRSSTSLQNVF